MKCEQQQQQHRERERVFEESPLVEGKIQKNTQVEQKERREEEQDSERRRGERNKQAN
jgi:hypothetical protein